jgi:hypothetical protein
MILPPSKGALSNAQKRRKYEREHLRRLPRETLNRLKQSSRPVPNLGVPHWQERWERGDYQKLKLWQIAWGLLRHSIDYWYDWAFDIGPRRAPDGSLIPMVSKDTTEWAKPYGLRQAINPSLSAFDLTENPFISARAQRSIRVYRGPRELNVVLRPNQALVLMDLSWPLAPQLAAAKRHLDRPRMPLRLRANKYPYYVCALDAKAAGASLSGIGNVLHRNTLIKSRNERVKNHLRAANSLGTDGYQLIARG